MGLVANAMYVGMNGEQNHITFLPGGAAQSVLILRHHIQSSSCFVLFDLCWGKKKSFREIEQRLAKAEYELTFADQFDHVVVNDNLAEAEAETLKLVEEFLAK